MFTTNNELFESFEYIDIQQLEKVIELSKEVYLEDFKGFNGTSLGTNMKDALSFCIVYNYIESPFDIEKLIWAMCSYQENFLQSSLIHLENQSCIKTKNLIPYFAVSVDKFSKKNLKNNMEYKFIEMRGWIEDFLANYNDKVLNYNLDTQNSKYIDKFLEIENRILNNKLENKLPEKLYDMKKRKI